MNNINVTWIMKADEEVREQIVRSCPQATIHFADKKNLTAEDVEEAEVIVGNLPGQWLKEAVKLRWLHLESAGAEKYVHHPDLDPSVILSNSTGAYGPAIAEHMLAAVLTMYKKLPLYHENQKKRIWHDEGSVLSLAGSTVLVVGLGDIGREFAWRMKALGCKVIGVKRTAGLCPDYVDELVLNDQIDEVLPEADIIAACLPSTEETVHYFDEERLSLTKKDCTLINVGRGVTVDTQAVIRLLDQGHFHSVILDVMDPEPLPMNSKLWAYDRVLLTPHVSGGYNQRSTYDKVVSMAVENIQRYCHDEPLKYLVDRNSGYRISNSQE